MIYEYRIKMNNNLKKLKFRIRLIKKINKIIISLQKMKMKFKMKMIMKLMKFKMKIMTVIEVKI